MHSSSVRAAGPLVRRPGRPGHSLRRSLTNQPGLPPRNERAPHELIGLRRRTLGRTNQPALRGLLAGVAAVLVLVVSGCSSSDSGAVKPSAVAADTSLNSSAPSTETDSPPTKTSVDTSLIATARIAEVAIRTKPGGPKKKTLSNPNSVGGPLTFLVLAERPKWLQVQLPTRPNGSTGWISASDVNLSTTTYRLVISMSRHRLDVMHDGERIARHTVGIGRVATPTPKGTYYLTELIETPDPKGVYGPYAFGLSAHSNTVKSYAGGPGQIGLHGTDKPSALGGSGVSHGCLRLPNSVITKLAHDLPLGTPIEIRA
jgi:lipoprotein-anchoring transpeptidase ErfK/SrfK